MNTANTHKLVFIETNPTRRDYLRLIITDCGYIPFSFEKETICLDNLSPLDPSLVISSLRPLEKAFRFLNTLKTINYSLPVVVISDDKGMHNFINVNGFDNIKTIKEKFKLYEIKNTIDSFLGKGFKRNPTKNRPLIIGQDHEILKLKKLIPELSRSEETLLIKGKKGTGKEHVARVLHDKSAGRNDPFVKVNAAELTHESLESELFGLANDCRKEIGTGRKDPFGTAGRGTLFLDAIDKTPLSLQGNLLYFLEAGDGINYGSDKKKKIEVRVIVSAGEDIGRLVETGKFRKDLYFRLNTISIEIPQLKNRIKDISLLADYFADKYCMEFGRSYYDLSKKTKRIFGSYHWPGNVQELENAVKNTVLYGNEDNLVEMFSLYNLRNKSVDIIDDYKDIIDLEEFSEAKNFIKDLNKVSLKDISREYIARAERIFMKKALERTNWNRKKAAVALDISYKSLLNKIRAYNLA